MNVASSDRARVVTIGGGTGSSILLRGLKRYADRIDITAIVTTFDDGGSSGRLRDEFGVPALGDLRRCIGALLPEDLERSALEGMLEHRFSSDGSLSLDGHSLGNLMLLGAMQSSHTLNDAIDSIADSLNLVGRVIPVSDQLADVCATLPDGTVIRGESAVGLHNQELFGPSRVFLDPPVAANAAALEALRTAHVVILGPGDLFTSVIPNLLPTGITHALQQSSARILQICNIATKRGETIPYAASDFATTANFYINQIKNDQSGGRMVDAMIINEFNEQPPQLQNPRVSPTRGGNVRRTKGASHANTSGSASECSFAMVSQPPESLRPVEVDERLNDIVRSVIVRPVADADSPRNHDPVKLASAVMEYVDEIIRSR